MEANDTERLTVAQIAGIAALAVLGSAVAGISVLIAVRSRRARIVTGEMEQAARIPTQPAVGTTTAAEVPHHFSEDLVVPGKTLTGQETIEQDNALGRSPEGV